MNHKRILITVVSVCLMLALLLSIPIWLGMNASAEVIYEETNPDFKFKVYDTGLKGASGTAWKSEGELIPFDGEKYTINTNSYCMWWEADDIAFAYNNYVADYGDKGTITVETTVLSRDLYKGTELHSNGSTGIAIRDNDSADSPSVYLHARANWIGVVYRTKAGVLTILSTDDGAPPKFPVKLKMEKTGNAVKSYYMNDGDNNWISLGTVYVKMDKTVMAGVAAHNGTNGNDWITTDFSDFKVTVEGPEGSKYDPGAGSGAGEEEGPTEPENYMPPDPGLTDNILFRETFTDGSLVNPTAENENAIANPIWESELGEPQYAEIVTDGDNRYWHRRFTSDEYYFPNTKWTDYSLSADMKFGDETIPDAINQVNFYVRHRAMIAYGYFGYRVEFTYGKYVKIHKYALSSNPMADRVVASVTLEDTYLTKDWTTWRVDAFDNKITVYIGDKEVISYTDEGEGDVSCNSLGGIGIGSDGADFYIDNIVVRKLDDLLGGDYDNQIAGNWDEDIPDYLKDFTGPK